MQEWIGKLITDYRELLEGGEKFKQVKCYFSMLSGRVVRSLWVRSGRGGQMAVVNYKVHEGKEDGGSSLHPGLGED